MKRRLAVVLAAAALAAPCAAAPHQPFQMVRSLQLVQDRIAGGDHAAMPMQQKLLGIIDTKLRAAGPADFRDRRNLRALLIYGLSGGNPGTLDMLLPKLALDEADAALGEAVVSYARGDFRAARALLRDIDATALPAQLGAPVALVAATVLAPESPELAVDYLDEARLLSPGTLIEEAALRRSIPLSAELGQPARFTRAARQYVDRFLRSPYASQFADAFVAAVVALRDDLDLAVVERITAAMSNEQARVVYLRLARKSAIEGYDRLLDFASGKARAYADTGAPEPDPRAVLYANMASITSANVNEVSAALNGIDTERLSAEDRALLAAAKSVARAVLDEPAAPEPEDANPGANRENAPTPRQTADAGDTMPAEPAPAGNAEDGAGPAATPTPAYVREARDRLEAIDALLVEDTQ